MKQDLQERLRRLGVTRGTRDLRSTGGSRGANPKSESHPGTPSTRQGEGAGSLEKMFPGSRLENTVEGPCFVVDQVYPLTYAHGHHHLSDLLGQSPEVAAVFCKDKRIANLRFRDLLFLDTETTGLAGAGSLAFMVGIAFYEQSGPTEVLVVRQYFLRDHGDEKAMLLLLDELIAQKSGLVTFNGRTFDIPLLDNRYLMNRMPNRLSYVPHIDLLSPARRLWRHRFGSVALGNLEKELLGVRRSGEDVPGWIIPGLYNDYLRSGDPRELRRVFYHNQIDMLSMITLANEVIRQFGSARSDDHPLDLFSLGKWQENLGLLQVAEENLRRAAAADMPLDLYHQSLRRLGLLLKRNGRRSEAIPFWQQWAATSLEDVEPFEELSKHYEWHEHDLSTAVLWAERALELMNNFSQHQAALQRPQLEHRLARLKRKLAQE